MRKKTAFPPYPSKPHASGKARLTVHRKDYYLGPFGSPESWEEYHRLLGQWNRDRASFTPPEPGQIRVELVEDLVAAFWPFAEQHYRHPDGTPTNEIREYDLTLRALLRLFGETPVREFGPLALKKFRDALIDGTWLDEEEKAWRRRNRMEFGLSRKTTNHRIDKVKRVFKWGVSEELVDHSIYERLRTVAGLQAGRTRARETEEVEPVPDAVVDQTLPHLGPVVRAMVQLQRFSGMRPGEVCGLTPAEVDREGLKVDGLTVWVYRPKKHKTAYRGHKRAVVIGPRAQAVLAPFLDRAGDQFCFTPAEAAAAFHEERKAGRKTPRYPSHAKVKEGEKAARGRVNHQPRYDVAAYGSRIAAACKKHKIPHWHPNQLRHAALTEADHKFGLDAARAMGGHKDARVTTIYAARDLQKAAEVAAKIG